MQFWKSRALENGVPGDIIVVNGAKPRRELDIDVLIACLSECRDRGHQVVSLDGLATLHADGEVMFSTEAQI